MLTGKVISRDERFYDEVRKQWNPWTNEYPIYFVFVNNVTDIKNAINYAFGKWYSI